ncbi:MAG: MATE family efflux transporter, partial [Clostridia bacterium]|nr:MATE family efflux transporter [Clostridia bacterium]
MRFLTRGLAIDRNDVKRIFAIMLPALVEMVLSQVFGMVDTIMLGNSSASTAAIAAVGLTNTPFNLFNGVITALNVGTTAGVAWAIGAKDRDSAKSITRTAIVMNLIIGSVVALLLYTQAEWIITFMKAEADAYDYAVSYLKIIAVGMLPMIVCYGITGALRGAGETRLPMYYNLFANFINVIGNYLLIYGKFGCPEMGVAGAGLSTTISRFIALVLAVCVLLFRNHPIRLSLKDDFRLRIKWLKRILKVGSTTAAEQLLMQLGFMSFALTVSSLGTAMFAAHQIALSINGLTWTPAQALGVAATTLTGQRLGAGEPVKARDSAKMIHRIGLCFSAALMAFFLCFANQVANLYTPDTEPAAQAANALRMVAIGLPFIFTQIPLAAALRGAGDTIFPLVASAVGIWTFRVFVAPIFVNVLGWGLIGAWLSIALDQ